MDASKEGEQTDLKEVIWPPTGFIFDQEFMLPVFCKPKLCPLKSVTMEKLESMQRDALEKLKEREPLETLAVADEKLQFDDGNMKTEIWKADD